MLYDSFTAWINSFLACMGGCIGSSTKSSHTLLGDDLAKGRKSHGRTISSVSDGFWTTSTHDVEQSVGLSHRSLSSISTSNQSFSDHGSGSTNGQNEFVNQGFLLWNQNRLQWTGGRMATDQPCQTKEPKISLSATYDSLLGNKEQFRQSIPLSEMVEFLVDIWEEEGFYD